MNYYADESEWKWLFKNAIDWDRIIPLYYPEFPTADGFNNKEEVIGFIEELITATGDWAGTSVANRARALDENGAGTVEDGWTKPGPELTEFYNEAKELSELAEKKNLDYENEISNAKKEVIKIISESKKQLDKNISKNPSKKCSDTRQDS